MNPPSACTSATITACWKRSRNLRDLGNTVIVVEHDEDAIRMADYLIDMGPGAGAHGGKWSRRHAESVF
jgi:excinuclease UvrABC ATPase subunit